MSETRSVSVVIPTVGRASLVAAVRSALAQSTPAAQVVIAYDGPRASAPSLGEFGDRVQVVSTGGGAGPNGARNAAIRASRGDLIALLDDDDEWRADKLETQLRLVEGENDDHWIATSAVLTAGATPGHIWPSRGPRATEPVADYLFVRNVFRRHPFLQTSTWLAPRSLFDRIPLREDDAIRIHDDFDWLIRAQAEHGVRILFSPEPTTTYTVLNGDSFGIRSRWEDSLSWISDPGLPIRARARADFALKIPFSMAQRAGGRRDGLRVVGRALRLGVPTALGLGIALAKVARG